MRLLTDSFVPNTAETSTHMELDNISFYKHSWTLIRVPKGIYILFIILKAEFQLPCTKSLPYPHFSCLICMKNQI